MRSFFVWTLPFFSVFPFLGTMALFPILRMAQVQVEMTKTLLFWITAAFVVSFLISFVLTAYADNVTGGRPLLYPLVDKNRKASAKNIAIFIIVVAAIIFLLYHNTRYQMIQADLLNEDDPFKTIGSGILWIVFGLAKCVWAIFTIFVSAHINGRLVMIEEFGEDDPVVCYASGHHYEGELRGDTLYVEKKTDYDSYGGEKAERLGLFLPIIGFPCWIVVTIIRLVRHHKMKDVVFSKDEQQNQ